jgi:hypothetical protein
VAFTKLQLKLKADNFYNLRNQVVGDIYNKLRFKTKLMQVNLIKMSIFHQQNSRVNNSRVYFNLQAKILTKMNHYSRRITLK